MTDEELWEDVHDIMGAGHETTATTTAAVLYCVSAHPEVARRVRNELSAVLGGADTSLPVTVRKPVSVLGGCALLAPNHCSTSLSLR